MQQEFCRTEILIGNEGISLLARAKVAVFGLGGVGSYVVEALARCGVGSLVLVDHDIVTKSNINRQLFALQSTVGRPKVEVAKDRIRDIDPDILVHTYQTFYNKETAELFDLKSCDYVIDAMDTVPSKLLLIENTRKAEVPIICSMGVGNKLDPGKFEITDISKTSVCPLAKVMRQELRRRRIRKVKVVYSKEVPVKRKMRIGDGKSDGKRPAPGSISFVPPVAGLMLAGEVVRDLLGQKV